MADKKILMGQAALTITALGLAFWGGRMTSVQTVSSQDDAVELGKLNSRSVRKSASRRQLSSKGDQVISSVFQLRKLSRHGGSSAAVIALGNMSSGELAVLARELSDKNAISSGYIFSSEISKVFTRWAEIDPTAALQFSQSSKQNSFKRATTYAIFRSLSQTDPELAREKLTEIADIEQRRSLKLQLFQELAKTDPQAWLQEIKSDSDLSQRMRIGTIVQEWALEDPVNAARLLQQTPESVRSKGIEPLAKLWGSKDPEAALAWAQSLKKKTHRNKAISALLGGIAVNDPDAALAQLDSLPNSLREKGITAIFKTLRAGDFDAALTKAIAFSNPSEQKLAFKEMISPSGYSTRSLNAEQLKKLADLAPNAALRNQTLKKLAQKLSFFSKQDAEKILQSYPGKEQIKIKVQMINGMCYSNPVRALELYKQLPPEKLESYTLSNIVGYLAKNDPDKALESVLKEKSPSSQKSAIRSVFRQIAGEDPEDACRRFEGLPQGSLREDALNSIAETWARKDPSAALEWADTLPDSEKSKATLAILPKMAELSPEEAASHVKSLLATTPKKSQGDLSSPIYYIMRSWSKTDPASAGAWVSDLEDGPTKSNAISQLALGWYVEDSDGVADWIDGMPDGKNRDESIRAISSDLSRKDPATAFAWAASIGNDGNRIMELSRIVRSWKSNDAEKAQKMVEKSDLSAEEQTRLMEIFE